ncbi:hypothetical protein Natoc_2282 [Natronococcus occultus SP4]|uniref:Uncharacterized protein n=1 Tax=Natronococcus occultus SP4 TaxID=694430 RepID=L0K0H2_9EURY|nr:hypothetical protein Natoc_2282 [Natronococcus occultus SP4]
MVKSIKTLFFSLGIVITLRFTVGAVSDVIKE